MKNKNALISRFMVAVVTFSIAGMAWASQEEAVTPEQSESEQVSSTLFGQLAAEFAQEYKAYKNNGLIGKGITLAGTYVWLNANRHPIMVAAAIAGNSKAPTYPSLLQKHL